ncbi:hypothetical protein B0H13DRAFT_1930418 [Mycena leptocephala]|nr:hypothetical protein B0H13DRAFT_1930418 [Mycena leptocephala]
MSYLDMHFKTYSRGPGAQIPPEYLPKAQLQPQLKSLAVGCSEYSRWVPCDSVRDHNPKDGDPLGILHCDTATTLRPTSLDIPSTQVFQTSVSLRVLFSSTFQQQPKCLCLFARAINLLARTDSDLSRVVQPRTSFNRTRSNIETGNIHRLNPKSTHLSSQDCKRRSQYDTCGNDSSPIPYTCLPSYLRDLGELPPKFLTHTRTLNNEPKGSAFGSAQRCAAYHQPEESLAVEDFTVIRCNSSLFKDMWIKVQIVGQRSGSSPLYMNIFHLA